MDQKELETLSGGEIVFQYEGTIYNRPCGRGICLEDTNPEQYLEYAVDGGNYYLEVVIRRLPSEYIPRSEKSPGEHRGFFYQCH